MKNNRLRAFKVSEPFNYLFCGIKIRVSLNSKIIVGGIKMKLTRRLENIISMCSKEKCIADIGTDHGYVPIELIEKGIAQKVIATDINQLPLEKARVNTALRGLDDRIEFRLGSGLKVLKKGDAQGVIIAGTGGELMVDMLKVSMDTVKSLDFILLQPAQNPEVIRKYIYDKNFSIIKEDLVREEDGRFYEFLKVRYDENVLGFSHKPGDFEISPVLIKNRNSNLRNYIIEKMKENSQIRSKLDLSYASSRLKHNELLRKMDHYEEALKWL